MKICDVTETSGGVEITVTKSKTKPRTIPCPEHPEHLMIWLRNHPSKDNHEAALWVTGKHNVKPIQENGIRFKLREAKKRGLSKKPSRRTVLEKQELLYGLKNLMIKKCQI
jgi:hypothetical protein